MVLKRKSDVVQPVAAQPRRQQLGAFAAGDMPEGILANPKIPEPMARSRPVLPPVRNKAKERKLKANTQEAKARATRTFLLTIQTMEFTKLLAGERNLL